jgi:hypothetical protein
MQDDACEKALAKLVVQPAQVLGVIACRGDTGLDLDAENSLPRGLSDQVNLMPALLCTQMMQSRARPRGCQLGT